MGINQELISKVSATQERNDIPEFRAGDTVKVHVKIKEGEKERIQMFEGFVLKRSGKKSNDATFTVRKESFGIGVEKTFHINSPIVAAIEVIKKGSVNQSKIFYMRDRKGKAARIKPRAEKKSVKKSVKK